MLPYIALRELPNKYTPPNFFLLFAQFLLYITRIFYII